MSSNLFKNKISRKTIHLKYISINREALDLNNFHGLICTLNKKPKQTSDIQTLIGNVADKNPDKNCCLNLFICLFGFYAISNFVGYLIPNPFYTIKQFYFKQFSLALIHYLIVKKHYYFNVKNSSISKNPV